MCLQYDAVCQSKVDILDGFYGTPERSLEVGPILQENAPLNPMSIHGSYPTNGYAQKAGCVLAVKMGFDCGRSDSAPAIDVAILVDTTPAGSGSLLELQSRAGEFLGEVANNVSNVHYAVIGYSQGQATEETPGFVDDEQDAVNAIDALSVGSGTYGAIYSAINDANALPWRPGARDVTVTLSTSRACSTQYCDTEADTGVGFVPLDSTGESVRRTGVYTRDQQWFFESSGYGEAIDDQYLSRPGAGQDPSLYIDDLESNFDDALTAPSDTPVTGSTSVTVNQSGSFNARDLVPFYADSPAGSLVWSVDYLGTSNGGGGGVSNAVPSRTRNLATHPRVETEDDPGDDPGDGGDDGDPIPTDMGPTFDTTFDQAGYYNVDVTAYLDGQVYDYGITVHVNAVPSSAPASPLLTSTIADGVQTLSWTQGNGQTADFYDIVDSDGNYIESVQADADAENAGTASYQIAVPTEDGAKTYTVLAENAAGSTFATDLVSASHATYSHSTLDGGSPSGGVLELTGSMTPDLNQALDGSSASTSVAGRSFRHR